MAFYNGRAKALKTEAIRQQSESAIQQLGQLSREDPSLFSNLATVISHFLTRNQPPNHLNSDTLPALPANDSSLRLVLVCLKSFQVSNNYSQFRPEDTLDTRTDRVRDLLPRIYPWLSYLINQLVVRDLYDEEYACFQQEVTLLCCDILSSLLRQVPWRHFLFNQSGFVKIFIRMAMCIIDPDGNHSIAVKTSLSFSFESLMHNDSWGIQFSEVMLEDRAWSAHVFLKPFMDVIKQSKQTRSTNMDILSPLILHFVFFVTCYCSSLEAHANLVKHDSPRWIATLLSRLAFHLPDSLDRLEPAQQDLSLTVLRGSVKYITYVIETFGYKVVQQVLDHRIITSVSRCLRSVAKWAAHDLEASHQLVYQDLEALFIKLFEQLTVYSTYISVIRPLHKALVDVGRDGILNVACTEKLKNTLMSFLQTVTARMEDRAYFDEEMKTANSCENFWCPRGTVCDGSILQCSGCRKALYCSRECQKAGWVQRHRSECKTMRQEFSEGELAYFNMHQALSRRQHLYQHSIFHNEIGRHREKVLELLQHRPIPLTSTVMPDNAPMIHLDFRHGSGVRLRLATWAEVRREGNLPELAPPQIQQLLSPELVPVYGEFSCGSIFEGQHHLEAVLGFK